MYKTLMQLCLLTSILSLTACSSPPTVGEQMVLEGANTKARGEKWTDGSHLNQKGNKKIKHGESMVKKGNKIVEKGKSEIHDGKNMNKKGIKMMDKSEQSYQENLIDTSSEG